MCQAAHDDSIVLTTLARLHSLEQAGAGDDAESSAQARAGRELVGISTFC
jgi:hypothetical protein